MTSHAYPTSAMIGDYARTAAGLVPATAILATVPVGAIAGAVLGGFAALFAAFGIRTALRHGTRLEMNDSELRALGPLGATIAWKDLDRLKLAYYSTRRDGRAGWMQLELGARRARLRLDSRIEGFAEVVERSAAVAASRGLTLSPATMTNLQALGARSFRVEAAS